MRVGLHLDAIPTKGIRPALQKLLRTESCKAVRECLSLAYDVRNVSGRFASVQQRRVPRGARRECDKEASHLRSCHEDAACPSQEGNV